MSESPAGSRPREREVLPGQDRPAPAPSSQSASDAGTDTDGLDPFDPSQSDPEDEVPSGERLEPL